MARKGLPSWIVKKYGVSKKAWAVHRSGKRKSTSKPKKRKTKKRKSRRGRKTAKRRSGGRKIFGTLGWKGAIASIASLSVIRIIINRLTGGGVPAEYVDSVAMIGSGVVGKATKIGTAHLLAPGIVLGASKLVEDLVSPGGLYTLPQLGGTGNGGYDY